MQLGESFLLKPSPKKISYMNIYNEKLFEKTFGVTKNKNYYLLLIPQKATFSTFFWTAFEAFF